MFHERLKEIMKISKIEPKELSAKLGVDIFNVYNWQTNKSKPSYEIICKIADFFNVSVDYLLGRDVYQMESKLSYSVKTLSINQQNQLATLVVKIVNTVQNINQFESELPGLTQQINDVFIPHLSAQLQPIENLLQSASNALKEPVKADAALLSGSIFNQFERECFEKAQLEEVSVPLVLYKELQKEPKENHANTSVENALTVVTDSIKMPPCSNASYQSRMKCN